MKMIKKSILFVLAFAIIGIFGGMGTVVTAQSFHNKDGKSYLIDQYNESWDITQAVSLGFKPKYFQYGIGRNTIKPIDDTSLDDNRKSISGSPRVIGIENGGESHAYVISRLARHEIANTTIGNEVVAVGY
jgi:hypothetical protein